MREAVVHAVGLHDVGPGMAGRGMRDGAVRCVRIAESAVWRGNSVPQVLVHHCMHLQTHPPRSATGSTTHESNEARQRRQWQRHSLISMA